MLGESPLVFECQLDRVIELDGSHLLLSAIRNIQLAADLEGMNLEMVDLARLDPVIYAPYQYFRLGERLAPAASGNSISAPDPGGRMHEACLERRAPAMMVPAAASQRLKEAPCRLSRIA